MGSKQCWFRAEASTRSFAIVISAYSAFVDVTYIWMLEFKLLYLWYNFQSESHGAGPCIIRGISIHRPAEPRSWTSSRGRQKLNPLFPWSSRGVRAQDHPECDRDDLNGYVCLGPPLLSVDFFVGKSNWLCAPCSLRAGLHATVLRPPFRSVAVAVA